MVQLMKPEEYLKTLAGSKMTERVRRLIDETFDNMHIKKEVFSDDGSVLNKETGNLPLIVRKAMAEKHKLEVSPVGIWPGQKFPCCYGFRDRPLIHSSSLPEYATKEELETGASYGLSVYSMFGHVAPDYPRVLEHGIGGILEEVRKRTKDQSLSSSQQAFLSGAEISLQGLILYAKRNCEYLEVRAAEEKNPETQKEYRQSAEILMRVSEAPPKTLQEAMQLMILVHVGLQLVGNYLSLGRADQYLQPYLIRDIQNGTVTYEEAQELFDLFFLKFNERANANETQAQMWDLDDMQKRLEKRWRERTLYDLGQQRYNVRDEVDAAIHWLQNIVVGGVRPEDGEDAANLTTVMMLESFRRIHMTNPVMTVRVHPGTPEWLYHQTAEVLKTGGGLPCLYNDASLISGFESFGFPEKDARDYANDGCWEIILPGKTDFYFNKINMLKCLEWTLNHGRSHIDGKQEVPDQGDPESFDTFEKLYEKLFENVRICLEAAALRVGKMNLHRSVLVPTPLLSALMDGPVESGQDVTDEGARYVIGGTIAEGFSHLIDSLVAMDEVIYKQKKFTIRELVDAIDSNYIYRPDIRAAMDRCPKYGMNESTADAMGRRLVEDYSHMHKLLQPKEGKMVFMPGIGTFSWFIAVGEGTGASPDGRPEAAPVASNFSPSNGAMTRGITSAILSFGNMGLDRIPLGSPLDLGISDRLVRGTEGTQRLIGLIKTFQEVGGNMMTISVADVQTLRDAQAHPENYRDLRVRMGGWSAYFTMLSKEQQEYHIQKSLGGNGSI